MRHERPSLFHSSPSSPGSVPDVISLILLNVIEGKIFSSCYQASVCVNVCVRVFQGILTLLSLQRLKRVCFEEEYEELFTHQPPELTHTHANMLV